MGYDVENTRDEIKMLEGGTITKARIAPPHPEAFDDAKRIELTIKLAQPVIDGDTRKAFHSAVFEVWQDAEGNGPGHIALVGFANPVKTKAKAAA